MSGIEVGIDVGAYRRVVERCVEHQSQVATLELADSEVDHQRLEALLERVKPPLPDDVAGLHYLLATPFRYPPLDYGSRFGTTAQRGVLYASESRDALLYEVAYYRFVFVAALDAPFPEPVRSRHQVITFTARTRRAADVTKRDDLASWAACQAFGTRCREAKVELIRYASARSVNRAANVAVLSPDCLRSNSVPNTPTGWDMVCDGQTVKVSEMLKPARMIERSVFEQDGVLPMPTQPG